MSNLQHIEQLAKTHSDNRATLAERIQALQDDVDAVTRKKLRGIKTALHAAAQSEKNLRNEIELNAGLFEKPRSHVFHGLKVGMQKGKGEVVIHDKKRTIKLIGQNLPERFGELVKVTESPINSAIGKLTTAELRRIGAEVQNAHDQIIVKPVDSGLEKQIKALLKDAIEEGTTT